MRLPWVKSKPGEPQVPQGPGILALDIGTGFAKIVQLTGTPKGYRLERFGIKPFDPDSIVEGSIVDATGVGQVIKDLLAEQRIKAKQTLAAISVSGHAVIAKKIMIPVMPEAEMEASVRFEAQAHVPFDVNEVEIDFHLLNPFVQAAGREQMEGMLVAVKKEKLQEYLSVVRDTGLIPVVVDVDVFALENMYALNYDYPEGQVVALMDLGASVANINILKDGVSVFTRDISIGGKRYTESIQSDLHISFEEAERAKKGEATPGVDPAAVSALITSMNGEIGSEILRSFDYFRGATAIEEIHQIIVSGGASQTPGLVEHLAERLGQAVAVANPFQRIEVDPKVFSPEQLKAMAPHAAVGVGLAVRHEDDR